MEKLKMQTVNKADENFKKLAEMFPNAVTESIDEVTGEVVRAIDKDVLMREIGATVVEGREERYQFTWPDKKKSILLANSPTTNTLRPLREESVDFDNTENLYIEGDNLEVLKLLQETYLGKIKMIYIDPPYNTGNDFVYNDTFDIDSEKWDKISGDYNEYGERMVKNSESNGRYHTDWLNMMYPRLKIARDLLTDGGVIFISIDDNEQENLKKICDEIFGSNNFIAQIIWERAFAPVNLKKHFSESHDYILAYSKNINECVCNGLPRTDEANDRYSNPDNDPRGAWQSDNLSVGPAVPEKIYEIITPNGRKVMPPSGRCWLYTKEKLHEMILDNRIWFGVDGNNVPRVKRFISEVKQGVTPMTIWKYMEVGHSQDAKQKLKELFDGKSYFDYPKSVDLIKRCLQLYTNKEDFVLDFFSGSATTAHAVMQLNAEDGGNRKFIMIQLPELTDEKSEAYKAGYKNICEIGKERIRRAGTQIIHNSQCIMHNEKCNGKDCENYELCIKNSKLDVGFRVLKCDTSNMKEVYYNPSEYGQAMLDDLVSNIKEDRTAEDLLFQVMLDLGILMSSKIEQKEMNGKKVYSVADNFLMACFDDNITDDVITRIAKQQPYYFVMRDGSLASDCTSVNFEQIFTTYSPDTVRRVI